MESVKPFGNMATIHSTGWSKMKHLVIYVCENFLPEFLKAAEEEGFSDAQIRSFPCMCMVRSNLSQAETSFQDSVRDGCDIALFCGDCCEALAVIPDTDYCRVYKTRFCSNHLSQDGVLEYIVQKQGYIVGSGWLKSWREHLSKQGFDQQSARLFFREMCNEIILFDAVSDPDTDTELKNLSEYLGIPAVKITTDLEKTKYLLRAIVYEWRLTKLDAQQNESFLRMQARAAEYSAVLDLLGKLATYTNKRSAIEKIKEIFTIIMGAQEFLYRNCAQDLYGANVSDDKVLYCDEVTYKLDRERNEFCIKITHKDVEYGVIHAGKFLFPEYIDEYLNFAIEIVRIFGLVLSNIEQYDLIAKSEKEYEYLSYHDALTGLYNRTYLNKYLETFMPSSTITLFSFDIDKLKYTNDTYGHAAGDNLIRSTATILRKCLREDDIVVRMGGDEFLAILPNCDLEKARVIEKRIRLAMESHNNSISDNDKELSVSFGFATTDSEKLTVEQLIQKADALMYQSKSSKRIHG